MHKNEALDHVIVDVRDFSQFAVSSSFFVISFRNILIKTDYEDVKDND